MKIKHLEKYVEDYQNKLMESYKSKGNLIIAYDFDDTVYPYNDFSKKYVDDVIRVLRLLNETGKCRFICVTCREGEKLKDAEKYLFENKIPYNAINKNLPWSIPHDPRKIYYSAILDDKGGLPVMLYILENIYMKLIKL